MTEPQRWAEDGHRHSYRKAAEVSGRPVGELGYWLALAVAAGADVAAFRQIVSVVLSNQEAWIVWLMVAGFTSCSLTLAHFAGRIARDVTAGYGHATRKHVMLLVIPWALLGLVAFAVRLIAAFDGGTSVGGATVGGRLSDQAQHVSSSFMFLVLYAASGAVAAFGVYLTRNPVRVGYRRSLRAYDRAVKRLAKSQPPYERAIQVWRLHARSLHREETYYQAAKAERLAFADELKRYAAVLIATHLQNPSATDGMTLRDRLPMPLPPDPDDAVTSTAGEKGRAGSGPTGLSPAEVGPARFGLGSGHGPTEYDDGRSVSMTGSVTEIPGELSSLDGSK